MIFSYREPTRRGRYLKDIFLRRTAARDRSCEKQKTKESREASEKRTTANRDSDSTVPASG